MGGRHEHCMTGSQTAKSGGGGRPARFASDRRSHCNALAAVPRVGSPASEPSNASFVVLLGSLTEPDIEISICLFDPRADRFIGELPTDCLSQLVGIELGLGRRNHTVSEFGR